MLEVLFSLRTVFYLAIVTVQPVMAEIDLETIVVAQLCNEGKGKILKDSSGNGHDGKFVKKEGWTKEGEFGNALEFAGDPGNNVEIPHADSLTLKEWTITAWVKQEQTPEWSVVLAKEPANGLQNYALDMIRKGRYFQKSPVRQSRATVARQPQFEMTNGIFWLRLVTERNSMPMSIISTKRSNNFVREMPIRHQSQLGMTRIRASRLRG